MRLVHVFLTLALILTAPSAAFAHAHLVSSAPAVGATVAPPSVLTITFSEGIELGLSKFDVTGPAGPVGGLMPMLDMEDARSVMIHLRAALPPGDYVVHWHVVSVDTHRTEGTYGFTVK